MKHIYSVISTLLLFLCSCSSDVGGLAFESHYELSGFVLAEDGSAIPDIEVLIWEDGIEVARCVSGVSGEFVVSGANSGGSFYWLTAVDYRSKLEPHFEGDSVRVVLGYHGGNGLSNYGNGIASTFLQMRWVVPTVE